MLHGWCFVVLVDVSCVWITCSARSAGGASRVNLGKGGAGSSFHVFVLSRLSGHIEPSTVHREMAEERKRETT